MKTKDLCQLFDLPRSAVRFYRNASLFSLQQDENGYFHYEVEEIAALYEVLKHRRKHDLSLEAITQRLKNQSNHSDNEEMINLFQIKSMPWNRRFKRCAETTGYQTVFNLSKVDSKCL